MILTETQTMIRDMTREFARAELAPKSAHWDRTKEFPREAVRRMGELGLMGVAVPEQWGGAGADVVSLTLAVEEISAADGACGVIMSTNNSLDCALIQRFGTDEQKERFLRPLASGEWLGCFCVSEPTAGSNPLAMRTRAVGHGERFVLNGTKQFITSGAAADIALVFAMTDPEAGSRSLTAFIVPTDTPGFQVARVESKLGIRASGTAQLVFDDLEVPRGQVLGEPGEGYRIALTGLGASRIGIAAQAVGLARGAFEHARGYAAEREAFGQVIASHQAIAFHLADMATRIEAARELTLQAAALRDAGRPVRKEAAMAKLFASEMAEWVCSKAIQVHGGYGYLNDFPVERIYRDARVTQIYEGTSEILRSVIAREIMEE